MDNVTRRTFVETALKGSVLSLTFAVAGGTLLLTPEQARAKQVPFRTLSAAQAQILELLGEAIVPGSAQLGLTHFLDHQLSADPNDALLIAKYFQVALPYSEFYAAGTKVATGMAQKSASKTIESMSKAELNALAKEMSAPGTVVNGFPIFLFYMCLRSDAVDVVYGTPEGFKKLSIPYMQHIMPPEGWDG
jgi:hypothetical protein